MNTMYSGRRQSDAARSWSARELGRLLIHWLVTGTAIVLIGSLFLLTEILPGETVPILISAFAMLGIGLAGFCLFAMAVGLPALRRRFYGPLAIWTGKGRHKAPAPWFDHTGRMLWQRDARGGWVRKVDAGSEMAGPAGLQTHNGRR